MVFCVVCSRSTPPLLTLNDEEMSIYEIMVSPFINLELLIKSHTILVCSSCKGQIDQMQHFRAIAVAGAKHLQEFLMDFDSNEAMDREEEAAIQHEPEYKTEPETALKPKIEQEHVDCKLKIELELERQEEDVGNDGGTASEATTAADAPGDLGWDSGSLTHPSPSNETKPETARRLTNGSSGDTATPSTSGARSKTQQTRTAYNHIMADLTQPDKPIDLKDLPLNSISNIESATPFAEPPRIAAPKSKAEKQREYRRRIAASRTPARATAARKSDAERQRNCRLRKAANLALFSGSSESTTAPSSRSGARSSDIQTGTPRQLTHRQRQTSPAEPAQITVQPGNSNQIEVPQTQSLCNTKCASSIRRFKIMAEPMDLKDLPLPSRSNVLTEAQDATASTSATPIAAPKSKAEKQREYRRRIAASRTPERATAARKCDAERQRNCRLRKTANLALVSGSSESTTASSYLSGANDIQTGTPRQLTPRQRQTSPAEPAQITVQPGTSDQIEVPQTQSLCNTKCASSIMRFKIMGETMDLKDLPLPSRSNVLTEAPDAAASTSATPIAASKSKAQKQREYRRRIAASRTPARAIAARKSDAERQRNCRLRKAANLALISGSSESTSRSGARSNDFRTGTQ